MLAECIDRNELIRKKLTLKPDVRDSYIMCRKLFRVFKHLVYQ